MAVISPCRSDLSPVGLSPFSHLADGRIRLILVKQCSQWDYLRFLASIPKHGKFLVTCAQLIHLDISQLSDLHHWTGGFDQKSLCNTLHLCLWGFAFKTAGSDLKGKKATVQLCPLDLQRSKELHAIWLKDHDCFDFVTATVFCVGVRQEAFNFVDIIDTTAVKVMPHGPQSSWNVDGELLKNNNLEAQVHRGLIRVFASGVPA